ncbi:replication initiation protein [Pseudomonas aeruginosa]|uniref:replication initiation protein n=2 Tax=Pseudomonas aeruginosa TaxID=287 RepID=UPI001C9DCF28|nr:replication initiation protein [Pseudomonas aeruginosa]MBY9724436.1 replication initiation protein [Pseudomonas aeruginosa]QZV52274.1 replication initiation protein [Pseudomonas aeruginosa]HCF3656520.1 replication initiation protein [Pseudomonas aeruginosa]
MHQLELFSPQTLPRRPYCTDDPASGMTPQPLQLALTYRHLQMNPPNALFWLVVDVDAPVISDPISPQMRAIFDGTVPLPNFLAVNPANAHAHVYYALSRPVAKGDHASIAATRYAAAIEAALIRALGGDPLYAGVIAKNPTHQHWRRVDLRSEPYTLHELEDYLDLSGPSKSAQRAEALEECATRRNCWLFDQLRFHAYPLVSLYRQDANFNTWRRYLQACAQGYNSELPAPLQANELSHIVKSVASWTWTQYSGLLSDEGFSKLQAHRGAKGGRISSLKRAEAGTLEASMSAARAAKAARAADGDKAAEAARLQAEGVAVAEIARRLGVSRPTVYAYLKKCKALKP